MRPDGIYPNVPESEYHDDQYSLSSTMAKKILESPAKLRHYLDTPQSRNAAFDLGSAVHSMALGSGPEVVPVEASSWQTKAAKEDRRIIEQRGAIPLLVKDYDTAHNMATAIMGHAPSRAILTAPGTPEVSVYATDPKTGVQLRGRVDWITEDGWLIDLKTCQSAAAHEFRRTVWNYSYYQQAAHYLRCYSLATGIPARGYKFIAVEKNAPHHVAVRTLHRDFITLGLLNTEHAIHRYAACLETGEWPGYEDESTPLEPEPWMTRTVEEAV